MTKITNVLYKKYKLNKVSKDFAYSIAASIITTGVMQFLVYPELAKIFDSTVYGQLLTTMGLVNTVSVSLGNTLNNTRLIQNNMYHEKGLVGDYNLILIFANLLGFFVVLILGNILFPFNIKISIMLSVFTAMLISRSYLIVAYRIKLNFKLNFYCNIAASIGYIIGIFFVKHSNLWPIVFITSELMSILFLLYTADLHKEPLRSTSLIYKTVKKYAILILTSLSGNLLIYLDRLIIYPLLGAGFVSTYTTASLFGKTLGIVMTPISGVLLGYFSQGKSKLTSKNFWIINTIVLLCAILFFITSLPIAPWFTGLLYPTLIEPARQFIVYANIASVINVVASMVQPAVLIYAPTYWQLIKEVLYGIIYIALGILLTRSYGLMGFCVASIIANSFKLCLLYILGLVNIK